MGGGGAGTRLGGSQGSPAVGLQPGVHLFPLFLTNPACETLHEACNGTKQAESTKQRTPVCSELLSFLPAGSGAVLVSSAGAHSHTAEMG